MRPRHRIPLEAFAAVALALVLGCNDTASAARPIVYECEREGTRVFSDRPCGADARPRRVEVASGAVRGDSAAPDLQPSTAAVRSRGAAETGPQRSVAARRKATPDCHALQQNIDSIDARMRLGYRGKEGEKLHARRRAATEQYRELRCNTTATRPRR